MFTHQLGFIDVREISSPLRTATASGAARAESTLPVAETLVGTSRRGFRSEALRIIREDPNHPLRFLLDKTGTRFKPTRGLSHRELIDDPTLVQMGHLRSDKLGLPDRIVLQGAWENQVQNITIERKGPLIGVIDPAVRRRWRNRSNEI